MQHVKLSIWKQVEHRLFLPIACGTLLQCLRVFVCVHPSLLPSPVQWTETATTSVKHLSHRQRGAICWYHRHHHQHTSPPPSPQSSPPRLPASCPPPPSPPSPGWWNVTVPVCRIPVLFAALLYAEQHGSGGGTLEAAVKAQAAAALVEPRRRTDWFHIHQ